MLKLSSKSHYVIVNWYITIRESPLAKYGHRKLPSKPNVGRKLFRWNLSFTYEWSWLSAPCKSRYFFVYMKSTASLLGKYIVDSGSPSAVLHFPAGRHFSAFVDDLTCKRLMLMPLFHLMYDQVTNTTTMRGSLWISTLSVVLILIQKQFMTVNAGTLTKWAERATEFIAWLYHYHRCLFLAVEWFSYNNEDIINSIWRFLLLLHFFFLGNILKSLWFSVLRVISHQWTLIKVPCCQSLDGKYDAIIEEFRVCSYSHGTISLPVRSAN